MILVAHIAKFCKFTTVPLKTGMVRLKSKSM